MGVAYNPKIITDGLVLYLDAANPRSYPGSGTSWNSLIAPNNNGTLYNTPTYNLNNLGYISFDSGSSQYQEIVDKNLKLEFQPTSGYSVFVWIYLTTPLGGSSIMSNMDQTNGYSGWDFWYESTTELAMHLISSWSSNAIKIKCNFNQSSYSGQWVNIGYTYDGSSPTTASNGISSVEFYINGTLGTGKTSAIANAFTTSSATIAYSTNQRFRISSRWVSGGFSQGASTTISNTHLYDRALTPPEITQNFNALKGRYGL